jgi:hypothetical protein
MALRWFGGDRSATAATTATTGASGTWRNIDYAQNTASWPTSTLVLGYGTANGLIGYGDISSGAGQSVVNTVTVTGVISSDTSVTGTALASRGGGVYGGNKGAFAFGRSSTSGTTFTPSNAVDLFSDVGFWVSSSSGVGTAKWGVGSTSFNFNQQIIFPYGGTTSLSTYTNTSNIMSNTGVMASDVTGIGTLRNGYAGVQYGTTGTALIAFGVNNTTYYATKNLISNTGVIASDTTGVGTVKSQNAGLVYSNAGAAVLAYGLASGTTYSNNTNAVSSAGVISTDVTGVGTARFGVAAVNYNNNAGMFAYGTSTGGTYNAIYNPLSSAGVISADQTITGSTARSNASGAGFGA